MENKRISFSFFIALFVGIGVLTFFVFRPFLPVLALAAIFAVILRPLYIRFLAIFRGRETPAALSVICLVLLGIILPTIFLGTRIFTEARTLFSSMEESGEVLSSGLFSTIEQNIQQVFPRASLDIEAYTNQLVVWASAHISDVVFGTVTFLFNLFLFVIALFFFFKRGKKYVEAVVGLSPLPDEYDTKILSSIESTINSVIKGALFIALIQGTLVGIGFTVFGISNAVLWGSIAALAALIPGIGTALVVVPGILYLVIMGQVPAAIGLAVWGAAVVGLIDNMLIPFFYGKGIEVDPLFVLFSVLGGLLFFGPLGFIFGPIVLSLCVALVHIYVTFVAPIEEPLRLPTGRGSSRRSLAKPSLQSKEI